jgi:predicted ribosome quality control (RQC) complex YloA/Tae2 family protein
MVVFFKSIDPNFTIYVGKDKYENEELLKYAFPIDVWFHVEDLSSAHVYLRLPEGLTIDKIPENILEECFQIVKDNSKEGRKKEKVSVCYTLWENLKKTSSMDIGEVGFKKEDDVRVAHGIVKNADLLKRLNKTREEKNVNLEAEKESFTLEFNNKKKKYYEDMVRIFIVHFN